MSIAILALGEVLREIGMMAVPKRILVSLPLNPIQAGV